MYLVMGKAQGGLLSLFLVKNMYLLHTKGSETLLYLIPCWEKSLKLPKRQL